MVHATSKDEADDLVDRLVELEASDALQLALIKVLSDRLAVLEGRAELDRDAETTVKQAAHTSGHSQTTIRRWLANGKLQGRRLGGRVLVRVASLAK
jgi:excisionase family DNA binding protein